MSRDLVVAAAVAELGQSDPLKYWREVAPSHWSEAQLVQYAKTKAWCGGFALWCLRQAGLAKEIEWVDGRGFLFRLDQTRGPQPGDIGYIDKPYQHHFVVECVDDQGRVHSIDGNQGTPGVQARVRMWRPLAYYSIGEWLNERDTIPAPPRHPVLRLGAKGESVLELQQLLIGVGHALTLDASFGPKTLHAVQSFQRRAGLDADGVVGPKTWKALEA